MHLTVVCPECQSQYQVDPGLRGKRMRCPNTICRAIFEVIDLSAPAPAVPTPSPPPVPGILVPPQDVVAPPKKPVAKAKPAWASPPPVRAGGPAAESAPVSAEPKPASPPPPTQPAPADDFPTDFPGDEPKAEEPAPAPVPTVTPKVSAAPKKKRGLVVLVAGLLVMLAALGTFILVRYAGQQKQRELDLSAQAEEIYKKGDFPEAMKRLQQLQHEYPKSKDLPRYRVLAILSELRAEVDQARDPERLAVAREHAVAFVDSYQNDPLLKEYHGDLWDTLLPLSTRLTQLAKDAPDAATLAQVRGLWARARPFAGRPTAQDDAKFQAEFAVIESTLADRTRRTDLLAFLKSALGTVNALSLQEAEKRIQNDKLADDPEIAVAWQTLTTAHRAAVVFLPAENVPTLPAADPIPVIAFTPARGATQPAQGPNPVLALSPTGVLYAFDPRRGDLRWVRRLGIDARFFPKQLGDTGDLLAVHGDRKSLARLDASTGLPRWEHPLSAACLAEPTVIAGRVLVPTTANRLEEIDLATGKLIGAYQFDQPLASGGTVQPGTTLVHLPGQTYCVYTIDVGSHTCTNILTTRHPPSSLQGPPIIVSESGQRSWLLLPQTEPGPRLRLRPFALFAGEPSKVATKIPSEADVVLAGTMSSPSRHDAESLLFATDEGKLHHLGLRLPGNRDPLVFPLTPAEVTVDSAGKGRSYRSQIVHADADHLWVLAQGRVHRLRQSFSPQAGPSLKAHGNPSPLLGDPLQPAQVHVGTDGAVTFFLATQSVLGPAAWLSALDGETGKVHWQRQLGTIPLAEPMAGDDILAWEDTAGVVFVKPAELTNPAAAPLNPGRLVPLTARGVYDRLLHQGKKWFHLSGGPGKAVLRFQELDPDAGSALVDMSIKLPAPPAGPADLGDDAVVVPLANGLLARINLADKSVITGPDWRAAGLDADTPGHVVALGSQNFAVGNGKGGITTYHWPRPSDWSEKSKVQIADRRFASPPLLITGPAPKLLLVDSADTLVLIDPLVGQNITRKGWTPGGKITAAPMLLGPHAAFVVDTKRLIWFDPQRDGFVGDYAFPAEIIGSPRLVGNRLIVADIDGNLWALDPATAQNLAPTGTGPIFTSRANIAPAAGPIPLPDGRLFLLWSDGTAGVILSSTK